MTDLWEWAEQLKKIWGLERPDRYRKDPEAQKCNELVEQLKQRTVLQEEPRLIKEAIQLSNDIWLSASVHGKWWPLWFSQSEKDIQGIGIDFADDRSEFVTDKMDLETRFTKLKWDKVQTILVAKQQEWILVQIDHKSCETAATAAATMSGMWMITCSNRHHTHLYAVHAASRAAAYTLVYQQLVKDMASLPEDCALVYHHILRGNGWRFLPSDSSVSVIKL